jgi:hypothetical protein
MKSGTEQIIAVKHAISSLEQSLDLMSSAVLANQYQEMPEMAADLEAALGRVGELLSSLDDADIGDQQLAQLREMRHRVITKANEIAVACYWRSTLVEGVLRALGADIGLYQKVGKLEIIKVSSVSEHA